MQLHWRGTATRGSTKHTKKDTGTLCVLFQDFSKLEKWHVATHRDYYLEEVLDWLKGSNLEISIIKINESPQTEKLRTLLYAGSESQHYRWKRLQRLYASLKRRRNNFPVILNTVKSPHCKKAEDPS